MRRAVITGIGLVSPLGSDLEDVWGKLKAGQSGIRRIEKFDPSGSSSQIAGEVKDFNADEFIPRKERRRMDLFSQYAVAAAKLAVGDSGLECEKEDPNRMGAIVGSGIGGLETLETQHSILINKGPSRCSPFMIPQMISNMAGGLIAIEFNLRGPNYCTVTACASSAHAAGMGMRSIRNNDAEVMIVGGSEASVTPLGIAGFCSMRALSTRNEEPEKASRPFDKGRDGFVMADGAAILVLEELEHAKARGARIYCELPGFGMTCDAFHMTAPEETGDGASRAMQAAMRDGGRSPEGVEYINAHGTSTPLNDKMETAAIKTAFGENAARKVMVSSSKSMTGHLLGAAGGFESAVCALSLRDGVIPPTINHEEADPECDLDYVPNEAREKRVNACLSNSLGFGGHNASLLFAALD
jgi:3-oxoacyl-[acyl-carrier-protein] synthase II